MVQAHPWFDCRPALIGLGGATPAEIAIGIATVHVLWAKLSDADKHRFHRYTCEGDLSPETTAVVMRITEEMAASFEEQ